VRTRSLAIAFVTGLAMAAIADRAEAATNFAVVNNGMSTWLVDGVNNPTLTLTRGQTYNFVIDSMAFGHPLWITTARGAEDAPTNAWNLGVTNNGAAAGTTLTFVVPASAPATLFYQCSFHDTMGGTINIVAAPVSAVPSIGPLAAAVLAGLLLAVAAAILRRRARG
jgi:hypothetical protein